MKNEALIMNTLRYLFENEITDLYTAEKQLLEAMPNVLNAVMDLELKKGLKTLLHKQRHHFQSLKHICSRLEIKHNTPVCAPVKRFLKDFNSNSAKSLSSPFREILLLQHMQQVQFYKFSRYSTATRFAKTLGYTETAELLQTLLNHESYIDTRLNDFVIKRVFEKVTC